MASLPTVRQGEAGIRSLVSESAEKTGLEELLSPSAAARPSEHLPQGAVAKAFPCSWTQAGCSLEPWQLPEKAEQALWPLSEGPRCFTSRSAVWLPKGSNFLLLFINGYVPLSTEWGETMNPTLNSRAGKAHLGKTQSLIFADYWISSMLIIQAFLPHPSMMSKC